MNKAFALAITGVLMATSAAAAIRLPAIISDHMVVQQQAPIPLWGWAAPNEPVTASMGGKAASAVADDGGVWHLALPPLDAGGPHELAISGAADEVRVEDVLVGEVWLGSGQSNMQWPVSGAANAEQEIAAADHPEIRMFTVARNATAEPQDDVAGQWQIANPDSVGAFSAVGFYFSRQLHRRLQHPVGFIHSSWGGTPVQAWTRRSAFAKPLLAPLLADERALLDQVAQDRAVFDSRFQSFAADSNVSADELVGAWDVVAAIGPVEFEIPTTIAMDGDMPVARFDTFGGLVAAPVTIEGGEVGWTFAAANGGQTQVQAAYGSGRLSGTIAAPQFRATLAAIKRAENAPPRQLVGIGLPSRIGHLFAGMIEPVAAYGIKGVVWYQGEANANRGEAHLYPDMFATLIEDWRLAWGRPLPFYFVQLANFQQRETEPPLDSAWAEVRDAQRRTLALPNTAMAVAIDIGDADDIHPKNKQEVGRRLALAALARQYRQPVEYSGPLYREAHFAGAEVRIAFDHADGLRTVDGDPVVGFAIAGADRKFVWADARIEGKSIVVWSDAVANPQAVRYGWGVNPATNLTNRSGLPASPFRTDRW